MSFAGPGQGSAVDPGPGQAIGTNQPGLRLFRSLIVVVALLYCVVTPPFQAPDETQHFFKACALSLGEPFGMAADGTHGAMLPAAIAALADRQFPQPDPRLVHRYRMGDVIEAWRQEQVGDGPKVFVPFPNIAPYAPTMYLPQALGIGLGRQLQLPPIGVFYLGRLTNALAGVLLILGAIRLAPFGAGVFLALAALPTTLFQVGSLSADSTIIGGGFLVTSLAMRAVAGLPLLRWEVLLTPAATALLTLAKGVYTPLAAAAFATSPRRLGPRHALIAIGLVLGCAAFTAWLRHGQGAEIQFSIISRKTLLPAMTARPADQAMLVLAAPLHFTWILATSFAERLPVYVVQVIGRFGWNAILLPIPLYLLGLVVVLLGLVAAYRASFRPQMTQRAWWLGIGVVNTILVETALYLSGTPLGADYIQGTQGRYFLPFLPLVGLALRWPLDPARPAGRMAAVLLPTCAALLMLSGLLVAANAFWVSGFGGP